MRLSNKNTPKYKPRTEKSRLRHKEDNTYRQTTLNLFKKYHQQMENPWETYKRRNNNQIKSMDQKDHSKYINPPT